MPGDQWANESENLMQFIQRMRHGARACNTTSFLMRSEEAVVHKLAGDSSKMLV